MMTLHLRAYGTSLAIWEGAHSVTCNPTQVNAPRLNPSHASRYSIHLPRRDGRVSWPRVKGTVKPLKEVFHGTATECHLPYGITQCYLPPDTCERAPPNPSHAGWYSIYLPRRDGRQSWPSGLYSAPAGSRTSDLSITSPTPNRCTTIIISSIFIVTDHLYNNDI